MSKHDEKLIAVLQGMDPESKVHMNTKGVPDLNHIKEMLGRAVKREEVDAAWVDVLADRAKEAESETGRTSDEGGPDAGAAGDPEAGATGEKQLQEGGGEIGQDAKDAGQGFSFANPAVADANEAEALPKVFRPRKLTFVRAG